MEQLELYANYKSFRHRDYDEKNEDLTSVIGATDALHASYPPRRNCVVCYRAVTSRRILRYGTSTMGRACWRRREIRAEVLRLSKILVPGWWCASNAQWFAENHLTALIISPDDAALAGGGTYRRIYVWMHSTGRLLAKLDAHLEADELLNSLPKTESY